MSLSFEQTTPLTEVLENSTGALIDLLVNVNSAAEVLISDATRDGGAAATAEGLMVNAGRLWMAWFNGLSKLGRTAADSLTLLTADEVSTFVSDPRVLPGPFPATPWRLEVTSATVFGTTVPRERFQLFAGGRRVDSRALPAVTLVGDPGPVTVSVCCPGLVPGSVELVLEPLDATSGLPVAAPVGGPPVPPWTVTGALYLGPRMP